MPRFGYSADISRSRVTATSALRFGARADSPAAAATPPAAQAVRNRRRVGTGHLLRRNDECPTNDPPMTKRRKRTGRRRCVPVFPSSLVGHWWGIRHFQAGGAFVIPAQRVVAG